MSDIEGNKTLIRRFVDAANARDYGVLEEIVAPDFRRDCPATPDVRVRSFEEFRAFLEADAHTFPDNQICLDTLVAEEDLVAFWATYAGTQAGPMGPFPASGRRVEVEFSGLFRIDEGRIAETRLVWDNVAVLTQLGHLSQPGAE